MNKSGKTQRVSQKALQAQRIAELEALLAEKNANQSNQSKGEMREADSKIQLDDLISVMSLLSYPLNLSTRERGQGKTIKFDSFGQIKKILYKDLIDVLEVSRHFMEYGYFIILDDRVIKAHGLQETYSKILTKDKIEEILSGTKGGLELYKSCNPEQQQTIILMIVEKLVSSPDSIDLNMVDKLSRVSGVNISQRAEDSKAYLEAGVGSK